MPERVGVLPLAAGEGTALQTAPALPSGDVPPWVACIGASIRVGTSLRVRWYDAGPAYDNGPSANVTTPKIR